MIGKETQHIDSDAPATERKKKRKKREDPSNKKQKTLSTDSVEPWLLETYTNEKKDGKPPPLFFYAYRLTLLPAASLPIPSPPLAATAFPAFAPAAIVALPAGVLVRLGLNMADVAPVPPVLIVLIVVDVRMLYCIWAARRARSWTALNLSRSSIHLISSVLPLRRVGRS